MHALLFCRKNDITDDCGKVLAGGIAAAVEQNVRFEDIDGTNGGVSIVRVDGCNTSGTDANVPAHGSVCRVTYRDVLQLRVQSLIEVLKATAFLSHAARKK